MADLAHYDPASIDQTMTAEPSPESQSPAKRGTAVQWWTVGCLTLLSMLAVIDKNVIALLIPDIQRSVGLSRTALGVAVGTAFAIGSLGFGIPAGWLADRFNRRAVIALGVVLWSVFAASCGFATSFVALFAMRIGVGVAESLIPPSAYSLIRDATSETRRARAFAIYAMANLLGTGLAFLLGGLLLRVIHRFDWSSLPGIGPIAPWSLALIVSGACGLPLVLLLLTVRDPGRAQRSAQSDPDVALLANLFRTHRGVLIPLAVFSVTQAMVAQSLQTWVAALADQRFGYSPMAMGPTFGILVMVAGPIGLMMASTAISWWERRGVPGAAALAVGASALLLALVPIHPLVRSAAAFWATQTLILLVINAYIVVTATTVARIADSRSIGKVMAMFLVAQGLFGAGLGPPLTAFVGDHLFSTTAMPLATGMSVVHGTLAAVSLAASLLLLRRSRQTAPARRDAI